MQGLLGNWLPEDPDKREAVKMGLLNMGAAMLANSQQGFAPSLGQGLLAGGQTYQGAQNDTQRRKVQGLQFDQLKLQTEQARREAATQEAMLQAGRESMRAPEQMAMANGAGPTVANAAQIPTTAPSFDTQGFMSRMMGIDPLKGIALQSTLAKETPFGKVDPKDYTPDSVAKFAQSRNFGDLQPARKREVSAAGHVYDPYSIRPGQVLADPNKPFSLDANGMPVPNLPYQQFAITKSKAGAPSVNVKTDVKTGESLGKEVGPMMRDSVVAAEGAVKQVDAANRVVAAVDSGKIIAGPGASAHLRIAQIGDALGVTGKDTSEKIVNTRHTIRGLAELTLQGRQQMRGQGAITESEGKLAEKAMSGDIDDLTPAEIRILAQASERAARFNHAEHQRKLQVMQKNPALQGLAPFYQGPAMPAPRSAQPAAGGADGIQFLGFE